MDYKYNIKGWLRTLNMVNNLGTDLFALDLRYTYDAAGNKLVKVVDGTVAGNNTRLDYSGNFLYENDELKAIFTSAGRIVPFDNGSETVFKFEYHLQDHLGNTRLVFSGHSNGQPELNF